MTIRHDEVRHRFVADDPAGESELVYRRLDGDRIDLYHTHVAPALRNRGVAGALTETALQYARDERLHVVPTCPYVQWWLARHPEYQTLAE